MQLDPFFDTMPGSSEPTTSKTATHTIGPASTSASMDGSGYYSAGGFNEFQFDYHTDSPGLTNIDVHIHAESLDAADGAGGFTRIEFDITTAAPTRYRLQADVIDVPYYLEVSFNDNPANAWYDASTGIYGGSFPLLYFNGNPLPTGWDSHTATGKLPAGTFHATLRAESSLYQGFGSRSQGTANLSLQLLGDVDLDGIVGTDDLNAILINWNHREELASTQAADLTGDGYVGVDDLNEVLVNWNANVQPPTPHGTPIPEPTSLAALLALSTLPFSRAMSRHNHTIV